MRALLGLLFALLLGGQVTAQTVTTWNPSDKSVNVTLSGGNLTATTAPSAYAGVRATTSHTGSGRYYFEVTVNSVGGTGAIAVGLANLSATLTTAFWLDTNGTGYTLFQDAFFFNAGGESFGSLGTVTTYGVAVDFTNKNLWIRGSNGNWNGSVTHNPSTNTGGLLPDHNGSGACFGGSCPTVLTNWNTLFGGNLYPILDVYNSSQGTANFGATSFVYTIPAGFIAWDGVAPASRHNLRFAANAAGGN